MRKTRATGLNLSALVANDEVVLPKDDPITRMHAYRDGHRAAAWLLGRREMRRKLHRAGEVDLVIPDEAQSPAWFRVAVEHLRQRKDSKWGVVVFKRTNGGRRERVYRVSWAPWLAFQQARDERWLASN